MPLEYEFGDEESQAFFDSVPFKKRNDKEYVRVHLGKNSCRRRGALPYSIDPTTGRLLIEGKPVNDGGYIDGLLKSKVDEEWEFGPGAGDQVSSSEEEAEDEAVKVEKYKPVRMRLSDTHCDMDPTLL